MSDNIYNHLTMKQIRDVVTEYWHLYYTNKYHCSLCGNTGWIHTDGVETAAGLEVGGTHECICPNGQCLRFGKQNA